MLSLAPYLWNGCEITHVAHIRFHDFLGRFHQSSCLAGIDRVRKIQAYNTASLLPYCPRFALAAKRTASSAARKRACDLFTHSRCSASGLES